MSRALDLALGVAWLLFWLVWFAWAATSKRSSTRSPAGMLVRLLIALIVIVLLNTGVFDNRSLFVTSLPLEVAGTALFVAGIAAAMWARAIIGRNWGPPMTEKAEPELVRSGPYRYIRHPIYAAVVIAMIGTALAVGPVWLVVAAILGAYFVYSAFVEERNLARLFPTAYPAYKRSTKMLIPFVL